MARVTRGRGYRVVMNREALDAITLGSADGLQLVGERIIEAAGPNVPDEPPLNVGLVDRHGVATYVNGKKVAGNGTVPRSGRQPTGIMTVFGYGFPARFNETGTIHQPARPFLTPAAAGTVPGTAEVVAETISRRLTAVRAGERKPLGPRRTV